MKPFAYTMVLLSALMSARSCRAAEVHEKTGVASGLCVVLDAADGAELCALTNSGRMLVHGLTRDDATRDAARAVISKAGLDGLAIAETARPFDRLPYADNLVNLLIADVDLLGVRAPSRHEILRVVAPQGVAYLKQKGTWQAVRKPLPKGMDVWPHWDYSAGGNPVNNDTALELVDSVRWVAGPSLFDGHGSDIGFRLNDGLAVFTERPSRGRQNQDGESEKPWLVGRDAHSGILRWRVPMSDNNGFPNRHAVVATAGHVYANLEPNQPMVAIDAATGRIAVTYDRGAIVRPLLKLPFGSSGRTHPSYHLVARMIDGRLFQAYQKTLYCLDAASGKLLWKRENADHFVNWIVAGDGLLFAVESEKTTVEFRGSFAFWLDRIVALDPATGKEAWVSKDFAGRGPIGSCITPAT